VTRSAIRIPGSYNRQISNCLAGAGALSDNCIEIRAANMNNVRHLHPTPGATTLDIRESVASCSPTISDPNAIPKALNVNVLNRSVTGIKIDSRVAASRCQGISNARNSVEAPRLRLHLNTDAGCCRRLGTEINIRVRPGILRARSNVQSDTANHKEFNIVYIAAILGVVVDDAIV
jgi:hypothetical protein